MIFQPDEDVLFFNEGEMQIMFDELNIPFSCEEIVKACKKLNCGKSAGPDWA